MVEFEIVADAGVTEVLTAREWAEVVKMRKHYYKLVNNCGQWVKLIHNDTEYKVKCWIVEVSDETFKRTPVGIIDESSKDFLFSWCCPEELNLDADEDYDDNGNVNSYTRHPSDFVSLEDIVETSYGERYKLIRLVTRGGSFSVEHGQITMFEFIGNLQLPA